MSYAKEAHDEAKEARQAEAERRHKPSGLQGYARDY
jgi:hypothetical protein